MPQGFQRSEHGVEGPPGQVRVGSRQEALPGGETTSWFLLVLSLSKRTDVKGGLELPANLSFHPDHRCLGEWTPSECVSSYVDWGQPHLLSWLPEGVLSAISKTVSRAWL